MLSFFKSLVQSFGLKYKINLPFQLKMPCPTSHFSCLMVQQDVYTNTLEALGILSRLFEISCVSWRRFCYPASCKDSQTIQSVRSTIGRINMVDAWNDLFHVQVCHERNKEKIWHFPTILNVPLLVGFVPGEAVYSSKPNHVHNGDFFETL